MGAEFLNNLDCPASGGGLSPWLQSKRRWGATFESRLEEQASAEDGLREELVGERAATEKRGHDLGATMGLLVEKI